MRDLTLINNLYGLIALRHNYSSPRNTMTIAKGLRTQITSKDAPL